MNIFAIYDNPVEYFDLKYSDLAYIKAYLLDLIKPETYAEMLADVEERTGLKINRIEVGKIDFLRDTAQLRIFYDGDIQSFGSSVETSDSSAD
jgi:hypothetical protein